MNGCQICLKEPFDKGQQVAKTICDHYFCVPCIETWHAINKSCPTCRVRMDPAHDVKRLSACQDCNKWVALYDFKRHRELECPAASQPCSICRAPVQNRDRDAHALQHFEALSSDAPASPWRVLDPDTSETVVERLQ